MRYAAPRIYYVRSAYAEFRRLKIFFRVDIYGFAHFLKDHFAFGAIAGVKPQKEWPLIPIKWLGGFAVKVEQHGRKMDGDVPVPIQGATEQCLDDSRRMKFRGLIQSLC
jgi:hypothetical protein